jgi:hypothetical protein
MMGEFTQYVKKKISFLFSPFQFRIIESQSSVSFGNAEVILKHEDLLLKIVKDRDQIFLDFQPSSKKGKLNWFSIDIVKQMITGKIEPSAEMNPRNIEFLKNNLAKIKQLFLKENTPDNIKELKKLERKRAKRLFP